MMIAQWGMFIYEDLIHLGVSTLYQGNQSKSLLCCNQKYTHPECYPIVVDADDTIYSKSTQCLPYARTATSPRENCSLGPREQANQATSYLDASHIYGSTVERANKLRAYRNGLLLTQQNSRYNNLLPNTDDSVCASNRSSQRCFLAGGEFTNLFPTQTALHTLWLRQHNNIAKQLKAINVDWDDEKLFQESRRIVIAQIQHITYNEFLPIIVGKNKLRQYGVKLRSNDYDSDYDLKTDTTALNEYASAVGLFFYSLFSEHIALYDDDENDRYTERSWSTLVNDPSLFYSNKIDSFLRYLLRETIRKPGLHMNKYFKNEFLRGKGIYGFDLAAMIIQMGRDHGIPGYTEFRSACGLRRPVNFTDLDDIVLKSLDLEELAKLYDHIDDVDLFVLGLAEKPELGALVGPTFACVIGRQFQKTRRGDRFWYENFFVPSAFTLEQLGEIRKTTLARIICDNSEGIQKIQPNVFTLADNYGNCPMDCNSTIIDTIDLIQWTDQEPRLKLPITMATLEKAVRLGAEHAKRLNEAEADRIRKQGRNNNENGNRNLAVYAHSKLMAPKKESLEISHRAEVLRETTKVLLRGDGLSEQERLPLELDLATLQRLLPEIDVSHFVGNITDFLGEENPTTDECLPKPLPCDHTTKYRTVSGWCNNLKFPHYGNAFAPMRRLLDPVYEDGFDSPRVMGRNRRKLPSARAVSNAVHAEAPIFHAKYTHMLMQMGQIIDHDFAHSPVSRGPGNTILDCSRCDSAKTVSIHCFPIPIENGDPYFPYLLDNGEPRCIPFTRSLLGQLTLGYRNQLDQLTSYIDASFIYGSTECEANKLRLFSQGRLNFTDLGFNREALPQGRQERDCRSQPRHPCFNAGDERSNEQPGLTVMHTLFLREHNRIAASLSRINNFWSDEKIYLETRRIMGAKIQHIIYNEWLPIVLGCEATARYDLVPRKIGYYKGYDDKCDATMTQEMATAAFRFGHTLIRNVLPRMNAEYQEETDGLDLKASFNNETFYYTLETGHIESVIMGLLGSHSMGFDRHISDAVRNHLFQRSANPYTGMDLPALNIQRGRDHGIPPYNSYREMCGMNRARNFDDLKDVMDNRTIAALRSVYDHVDDIDLFPGIMSERPLKGALVGPMLTCIIAEQFQRLKRCDRFYYENDHPATKFTPDQLAEIRKTTLSKLICSNSQYAHQIQPNAFLMPDDLTNAPMKCSELPDIDLYEWLDRQFCVVDHRVINLGRTKRITPCITCTCTAEGPECHSMIIDRCETLLTDYLFSEVITDTVCVIQCSSLIRQRSGQL
uniref:Peroxidase n=1 Tax=Setaria digitata TaxID=48799 RepID=A0A915PWL0_9BILA